MRKTVIYTIIAVLIIAVILRITLSKRSGRKVLNEPRVAVEVAPAAKGNVKSTNELLGTIQADKTAQVFPEAAGRVNQILVKEGSYVSRDSKIMTIRNETVGFEYEEASVRSPINGTVASILVDVGTMVTPQMPIAVVVDFAVVTVEFNISEVDIGTVRKNGKVEVEIDALPDKSFNAKISEISPVVDPMTHTVAVKATTSNVQQQLKPGMTAKVRLGLGERRNVITVPRDALLSNYVFVVKDSIAERRNVVIGLVGDENVEIVDGLRENELVVVVGQQRLAGSERVSPVLRSE